MMADVFTFSPSGTYDFLYFAGLFMTGCLFGLTVCSFSCIPLVCTVVMGTKRGFRSGFVSTLIFSAGRIVGYTAAGILCGLTGKAAENIFQQDLVMLAAGILFLFTGCCVFFSSKKKQCKTSNICFIENNASKLQLSSLGLITGMMPCIPYTAIMAGAAASGSFIIGGFSAFCFGLGTSLSPLLLVGGGAGWFSKKLIEKMPDLDGMIRKITGVLIMIMGIKMFNLFG